FLTYADAAWVCLDEAQRTRGDERRARLADAEKFARKLTATRRPLAGALADQIRAQALILSGQTEAALPLLNDAQAELRRYHSVYQYATTYLYGRLLGGDDGKAACARATNWAESEGIACPERWFAMFAPALRALSDVRSV